MFGEGFNNSSGLVDPARHPVIPLPNEVSFFLPHGKHGSLSFCHQNHGITHTELIC